MVRGIGQELAPPGRAALEDQGRIERVRAVVDPLPQAFAATIGRLMPLDGRVGVALLLTLVIEIMSCFGLAGLRALREGGRREEVKNRPPTAQGESLEMSWSGSGDRAHSGRYARISSMTFP